MSKLYYVYILCDKPYGTLYIGFTGDLGRRMYEHQNSLVEGFTKKYGLRRLVYAETYEDPDTAIHRETCLKRWNRRWKIELIEKSNPTWADLSAEMYV